MTKLPHFKDFHLNHGQVELPIRYFSRHCCVLHRINAFMHLNLSK